MTLDKTAKDITPMATARWIFLDAMSDDELVRAFDTEALLTLDVYAALWERGLVCYSDKGLNALARIGER